MDNDLDSICERIQQDLEMARALQKQGAILNGDRKIDKSYTHLYEDTTKYFKSLSSEKRMAIINLFLKRYSKKD